MMKTKLKAMKVERLKELCLERGLSNEGNKGQQRTPRRVTPPVAAR